MESVENQQKRVPLTGPEAEKLAVHVSVVSIVWNVILTALKVVAGIIGRSGAMISDGVHSASDVFSTVVVIIGVKMSGRKADQKHPYGYERMECVAAIILALMLGLTGAGIGIAGVNNLIAGVMIVPTGLALIAAIVSILVKEGMYWYTRAAAKKINSGALMADAWHHRSDALSSVGSFLGILGAQLGFPWLDPLAAVLIALFVFKVAVDIFRDAVSKMTDRACPPEEEEEMKAVVLAESGVLGIDMFKTRLFSTKVYVEMEIATDGSLTLDAAHEVAHRVHDAVEEGFPLVKHCTVHVNPKKEGRFEEA